METFWNSALRFSKEQPHSLIFTIRVNSDFQRMPKPMSESDSIATI